MSDKRSFLTHEKNLVHLVEFSKNFRAKIFNAVAMDGSKLLSLRELAAVMCDPHSKIENQIDRVKSKKPCRLAQNQQSKIQESMRKTLLQGKTLQINNFSTKYKISRRAAASQLISLRAQLNKIGYKILKVGIGEYIAKNV
jgi:hypothetical protein